MGVQVMAINGQPLTYNGQAIRAIAGSTDTTEIEEELTAHIEDTSIHVTSSDKSNWNNKLSTSGGTITGNLTVSGTLTATATNATNATNVNIADDTSSKLYVLGALGTGFNRIYRESSVYMSGDVLYGAAWNDYAEYRQTMEKVEPGRVVQENGDDTLNLANERLAPGCLVVSDTFGFAIGKTEVCQTPIAVSGRVLVYPYEPRDSYKPGDAVCSGPNGTISKMSREEIKEFPERIVGTVSAIPTYEVWGEGKVPVNGRIWIKVK